MRKRPGGNVLDFQEFHDVIASANSGEVNVVELQSNNISSSGQITIHQQR